MVSIVNKCFIPTRAIPKDAINGPRKCENWPEIVIAELAIDNSLEFVIWGIRLSLAGWKNVPNDDNKNVIHPINKGLTKLNIIDNTNNASNTSCTYNTILSTLKY